MPVQELRALALVRLGMTEEQVQAAIAERAQVRDHTPAAHVGYRLLGAPTVGCGSGMTEEQVQAAIAERAQVRLTLLLHACTYGLPSARSIARSGAGVV